MHFPSDSESGRLLARLFAGPEFAAEFGKVGNEWSAVRVASPD